MYHRLLALVVNCEPEPDRIIIDGSLIVGGEMHTHDYNRITTLFRVSSITGERHD